MASGHNAVNWLENAGYTAEEVNKASVRIYMLKGVSMVMRAASHLALYYFALHLFIHSAMHVLMSTYMFMHFWLAYLLF